ncbi:MAG: ATP-binding cassette domain-containing protein [Bacillota bacterium]
MKNAVFILSQVVKRYDRDVLRIDSLILSGNRIYGIIGPSGAGKSTLLRLLACLEEPSAGKIAFYHPANQKPVKASPPLEWRRLATLVFQKPILFNASVLENVTYGLRARGMGKKQAVDQALPIIEKVGMLDLKDKNAGTLSGGEAQRVALARAIAFNPPVLLLDEPTANLDPANVELLERIISELNREQGTTIVLVTHNIWQAQRITHETLFFYQGSLVEKGNTEEFFANPQDVRTQDFIQGRMIF